MSKVRVYELARELKIESKVLVSKVKDMGIDVSSHQSTLSADQVVRIKRQLQGGSSDSAKAPRVIRRRRKEVAASPKPESATPKEHEKQEAVASQPESPVKEEEQKPIVQKEHQPQEEKQPEVAVAETAAELVKEVSKEDQTLSHGVTDEKAPAVAKSSDSIETPPSTEQAKPQEAEVKAEAASEPAQTAQKDKPQESEVKAEAVAQSKEKSVSTAKAESKPARSSGGATIVRRATKEEVARVQRDREEKAERRVHKGRGSDQRRGGPHRGSGDRERSPGGVHARPGSDRDRPRDGSFRPPQSGQAQGRGERPSQPNVAISASDFDPGLNPEKQHDRVRDKKKATPSYNEATDDSASVKKAVSKMKRDQFSVRNILSQIDSDDEETPVVAPGRKKTVYTPQASSRKRDIKRRKDLKKTQITTPRAAYRVVKMGNEITVADLAKQLSVKASEVIKKLMGQGIMATINQNIDFDVASIIASEYKFEVKSNIVSLEDILAAKKQAYAQADQVERPPIVTIMGHVDHGKTSILDAIRKAKVAAGEAGGITQHIGAYKVDKDGKEIAFLDTPGHEAFSAMRSRGAQVTDIVVLVVAADDGVMPQTIEAISHAKDAGVPIIVAVNKIDKPNINLDRVYTELTEHGIQSEEWGGDTQFVKVSALQGTGLDDLLEAILLQAEILELHAAIEVPATGVVVEAHLDRGRGPVATMIVRQGTLHVGDFLVVGTKVGRVRAMQDHLGRKLENAGPSTPVEIIGLSEVPMAGDSIDAVESEKQAREVANWREENEQRGTSSKSSAASLDELLSRVKEAEMLEVPVIIKADTQGSVEAVAEAVLKLNTDRVRNKIVHKAVGGINESDISLAETSGSVVLAFNVRAARGLDDEADKRGVPVKYFSVIYEIVDVIRAIMAGKLPPVQKEVVIGHAEVRDTIKVPKVGLVAGTAVTDGKVTRNSSVRLIRDDVVIFSGRVGSLRRFKDDVKEVAQGYECGIGIDGYQDIRIGDILETFVIEEEAPTL